MASPRSFGDRDRKSDGGIEVWLREFVPVQAEALKLKVSSYIQGKIGELLDDVAKQAKDPVRPPR
ncbi:hypothetical protein VIMS_04550 [Mycobacterium marinum]|nr:hypothetical protein VIMS_04550 [Mycobacterium marinum]